jgi:hypothetical protein
MGHPATTLIYSDYAPSEREAEWVERAFALSELGVGETDRRPLI